MRPKGLVIDSYQEFALPWLKPLAIDQALGGENRGAHAHIWDCGGPPGLWERWARSAVVLCDFVPLLFDALG